MNRFNNPHHECESREQNGPKKNSDHRRFILHDNAPEGLGRFSRSEEERRHRIAAPIRRQFDPVSQGRTVLFVELSEIYQC